MKIGIVGLGVVGTACKFGFELLGHDVSIHDLKLQTTIEEVLDTEIVFICVPTPESSDGSCNISIVESVIDQLSEKKYKGIVAIKSTITPGSTEYLSDKSKLEICFVPEFLRERCAITDFTENHDVCIVGSNNKKVFEKVKQCHGNFPDKFIQVTPSEAEFCKYFNNVYNAMLIIFANSFYEICTKHDVNYSNVKNAIINRNHINANYLECNKNFRGFGGVCLPKDTAAIANLAQETNVEFFKNLLKENAKYKITVYEGMRKK
jgi:UDPglucose 6-dehydrogenase